MRILHVIATLDPAVGGPPMIAARLAAAQAGLGHTVTIVTHVDPGRRAAVDSALASVPGYDGVTVTALPPPSMLDRWWGRALRAPLQEAVAAADVVHLHGVWDSILRVAADAARQDGKPYFVLLNGMLDPWSLQQKALKKKLALALGYRRMLDGAAALHLGNADEQRLIEPLGLTAPGVIIPNGVFLEEVTPLPARGTFHTAHPELRGHPFVLFLGRLHAKKGLDILADAFAIAARGHDQLQLVIAGPDGGERKACAARIAQHGLTERVHFVGPLYGPDKLAALADATCFCLPSHQEGFSLAVTEALACGVPVVLSEGCHFPEVAEAGASVVLPLDPSAFAEALLRLANNPTLWRRMSTAARELIESRYTWPRIAQQTLTAYEEALVPDV